MLRLPNLHLRPGQVLILLFTILTAVIPATVFVASRNYRSNSSASEKININQIQPVTSPREVPKDNPLQSLLNNAGISSKSSTASSPLPDSSPDTTIPKLIGPSLKFKVKLEGRPDNNQATKLFVGIASGTATDHPSYLLTFSVDVPANGEFSGLSLSGLTPNAQYTAYLKGPAQIATSSAFVVSPSETTLNPTGEPLVLLSGDLNEDNRIDNQDLAIIQKAFGASSGSPNWNNLADFNLDGAINSYDLSLVRKNQGLTGASGAWYSVINAPSPSPSASKAGGPAEPPFKPQGASQGYWMWFPKL